MGGLRQCPPPLRSSPQKHVRARVAGRGLSRTVRRGAGIPWNQLSHRNFEAPQLAQDIPAAWATGSPDERRRIVWSVFEIIRLREGRIVSVRPKSATAPLLALACSIKRSRPGSARPDCDRRYPLLTVCGRAALASARYASSVSRSRLVLAPGAANAHPGRLAPSRALRTAERGLDVLRGRDERVRLGHGDLLPLLRVHL